MDIGYFNGKTGPLEEMTVPMNDRAIYFGDGIYEATYARNGKIHALKAHMDRFENSCRLLSIQMPMSREELEKELFKCVSLSGYTDTCLLYWQLTRGTAPRKHTFPDAPSNLLITVRDQGLMDVSEPDSAILMEDTRFLHCNIKTLNLIPNVMASEKAKQAGCYEVIFHRGDRVTEGAHSNIHILKNGVFKTGPLDNLILPGTTRLYLLNICRELGIPYEEKPFTVQELMDADEIMVTSAGTLGLKIRTVDGKPVGGKDPELFARLQNALFEKFYQETAE